jgi:AcrR family transcriptional regulator
MTEATGLTKGSIYGNFEDKDAVALAAFDYNARKVQEVMRREMDKHESIREKLLVYVYVYEHREKFAFPQGGCPLLNTTVDADDTHPELRAKVSVAVENMKERLTALIEEGKRKGEFSADLHAEQAALTLIATIEGYVMLSRLKGMSQDLQHVARSIETMIRNF